MVESADRGGRNYHNANLMREAIDEEFADVVMLPAEVAKVALRELNILIRETGGPEGHEIDKPQPKQAIGPLAVAAKLVRDANERGELMESETMLVNDVLTEAAELTGTRLGEHDPLQDDVFRARNALQAALGGDD